MAWDLGRAYREHLTSGDLAALADITSGRTISDVLSSADAEALVFGPGAAFDPRRAVSPFLTFAVAVHHVTARLATASYIEEWIGPRRRVPVFAVAPLRQLLDDPLRRFFFVELLSSYTHVVSGRTWVATRRGWRRRRFSELDAVQLAELLETVPPAELSGVLRRLGDLALFLTGVFPDHTATTPLGRPSAEARLLRSAGVQPVTRRSRITDLVRAPRTARRGAGMGSPCNDPRHRPRSVRCSRRSPGSSPTPAGSSTS